MIDWRPINTASRDGSEVLVYANIAGVDVVHLAFWVADEHDTWREQGFDSKDDAVGWWSYVSGSVSQEKLDGYRAPTHWAEYNSARHVAVNLEIIDRAAVMLDGEVWQLPRPARHHHILRALDHVLPGRSIEAYEQGFVTSRGRYVGREEAARLAVDAGQVTRLAAPPSLFSEDLW